MDYFRKVIPFIDYSNLYVDSFTHITMLAASQMFFSSP